MNAIIRIDEHELKAILRSRMAKLPGVVKVMEIKPVLTFVEKTRESRFDGMEIAVELGESCGQRD